MRKVIRVLLPLVALGAGIAVMVALVKSKPGAKKKAMDHRGTLVEVQTVKMAAHSVDVYANGTVAAEYTQVVSPEVGGRIIWLNDDIEVGSRFQAKEKVARIDGRDYYLAIQQQKAAVDSARTALEIEQGRRKIAEREWKAMGGKTAPKGSLALREPQLRTARMQIKAARSGLLRSKLTASKTLVRAPFNGIVIDKRASLRQLVMPGTPLITLASTDRFLVEVSVPLRRLDWIKVPGIDGVKAEEGSAVEVRQSVGEKYVVRMGRVIRMNARLDPRGRMAQLISSIEDPLNLNKDVKRPALDTKLDKAQLSGLPMLINAFVNVRIVGKQVHKAIEVPRIALHEGKLVYVRTQDNTLDIRHVHIVWRLKSAVLVDKGLADGDQIITSPLAVPLEGMKLRVAKPRVKAKTKPKAKPAPAKPSGADRAQGAAAKPAPAKKIANEGKRPATSASKR